MRPLSALRRHTLGLLIVFLGNSTSFGQSSSPGPSALNTPSPNALMGPSPLVSTEQSARETLTLPSGSLDLSIPIVSFPQMGGRNLPFSFVYSTNETYSLKELSATFAETSPDASPCNDQFYEASATVGWVPNVKGPFYGAVYVNVPTLSADRTYVGENHLIAGNTSCGLLYNDNAAFCLQGWVFKDWSGTSHTFDGFSFCSSDASSLQSGNPPPRLSGTPIFSKDGAGYELDVRNATDLVVRGPDGTIYHFPAGPQNLEFSGAGGGGSIQFNAYAHVFTTIVDPNGNTITATPQGGSYLIMDTVGRQITIGSGGMSLSWQQQTSPNGSAQTQTASVSQTTYSGDTGNFPATDDACVQKPQGQYGTYVGQGPTFEPPPTGLSNASYQTLTLPDNSKYKLTFDLLGQLARVDYPTGGYSRYDYAVVGESGQVDQGDMMCTKSWRSVIAKHVCALSTGGCTPSAPVTSASVCQAGTSGGEATTCYGGSPGQYFWGSLTVTDPDGTQTLHEFAPDAGPQPPPSRDFSNPDEYLTQVQNASGQVLRTTQVVPNPDGSVCTFALANQMIVNAGPAWCSRIITLNDVSPTVSSTETTKWWLPGLPLSSTERDFSGNTVRTVTNSFETAGIYALGTTSASSTTLVNVLDHVRATTTADATTGLQVTSTYTYDPVGNLAQVDTAATGAATASTKYQRDSSGNITQHFDPMEVAGTHAGSTNMSYEIQSIQSCPQNPGPGLPTSVTDALGHTTLLAYNESGRTACTQDPNGQITRTFYDGLGRTIEIDYPDGGKVSALYNATAPLSATQTVLQDAQHSPSKQTIFDGLGRPAQQILQSPDEGQTCTETFYDNLGRVSAINDPVIGCLGSIAPNASKRFLYDALSRKTKQINEDASFARWVYSGTSIDSYDESSNHSQQTADALGRLVGVLEPNSSNSPSLQTSYTYDGFGNLRSSTQTGASGETPRSRTFTYDGLSRLLTASNPETGEVCYGTWSGGSPGIGTCQGGYDLNGNLLAKTDARTLTSYGYDSLNRLLSKTFSDGTLANCFQYDAGGAGASVSNVIGRLAVEWTQPGACSSGGDVPTNAVSWKRINSYDAMGRVLAESQCPIAPCSVTAPGKPANPLQYSYDLAGNLTLSTNGLPTSSSPGIQFTYGRDAAGRPSSVTSTWSGTTGLPRHSFQGGSVNWYIALRSVWIANGSTSRGLYVPACSHDS